MQDTSLQPSPPDRLHPLVLGRIAERGWPDEAIDQAMFTLESTLYTALEARGHRVEPRKIVVGEETFSISIHEPLRQTKVRVRRGEPGYQRGEDKWRAEYVPSGKLTLVITRLTGYLRERRWAYHPGRPPGRQVDALVRRFEGLVQELVEKRIRDAENEKKRERSYRRMAKRYRWDLEAEERPTRLRSMAADWQEVQRIRAFLNALEARLAEVPSDALSKWLAWARGYAEELDPFSADKMDDLEDHAAILAKPKRGKPEEDEMELRELGFLDEYL